MARGDNVPSLSPKGPQGQRLSFCFCSRVVSQPRRSCEGHHCTVWSHVCPRPCTRTHPENSSGYRRVMSLRVWGLLGCLQGRRLPTRPRSRPGWLRVPNQSRPRPEKTAGSQISWAALTEASRESGDPPAALTLASVIVLAFGSRRPGWVPRSRRLVASLGALLVFVGGPPIPALAPPFRLVPPRTQTHHPGLSC